MTFVFEKILTLASVTLKLHVAPFQYQEYEYGPFHGTFLKVYCRSEAWQKKKQIV